MLGNEIMLFELRDIFGNVKEMVYSILIWPFLYLMRAEYTKLTKAAHKTDHYPTPVSKDGCFLLSAAERREAAGKG